MNLIPELSDLLTFKRHLRVEKIDSEVVFVLGETQRSVLSGKNRVRIIDLIDGERTVDEILRAVSQEMSEAEALYILSTLIRSGYLVNGRSEPCDNDASLAFWHGTGVERPPARVVSLSIFGGVDPRLVEEALRAAGLVLASESYDARVVVTDDYLCPELSSVNEECLARGTPWFLMKPCGARPFVGPLLRPGKGGACWLCMAHWLRNNRPVEALVQRELGMDALPTLPQGWIEASVRAACNLGSLVLARELAIQHARVEMIAVDLVTLQNTSHAVNRRPQCPACGDPSLVQRIGERALSISAVQKAHYEDGGYRRQTPHETFEQLKHLVSPITGAVTHVVPFPGRHTPLRAVYASGYLVCPRVGIPRINVFDKACAGKGRSDEQAKASAISEAIERFSGVYQGDEARVRAKTRRELGFDTALSLSAMLNFSTRQYESRVDFIPERMDWREFVPEPIDDDATAIDWSPAWSLTHGARRYVPFAYCYAEAPPETGTVHTRPCGNGVAAGTCIEEAILQGLLELVERDAAALWWYTRARRPAIDLASFDDSYFDALQKDYSRLGWRIWVLDLTHDLSIPACVALGHNAKEDRFSIGFGCHLEGKLAVQRALTEQNQIFEPTSQRKAPWDLDAMRSRDFLFPSDSTKATDAASFCERSFHGTDLAADIEHCVGILDKRQLEVVAVDKTRPDLGLCVVQVIVPGLRHFWPRFGPGRLYRVPHELGWTARILTEDELNPVHLFV